MLFFQITLGLVILAAIIYVAVSKKSSFKLRIAALGALALMIIAVIICLFVIFGSDPAPAGPSLFDTEPSSQPPVTGHSPLALVFFIIFLLAFFLTVLLLSLREQRQSAKKNDAKSTSGW